MAGRPHIGRVVTALPILLLFGLLVSGCETDTPQNTFDAKGEVARTQRDLFYIAMWPALVVMVLVLGVIVLMLIRFRRREGDRVPKQVHGNTRLEIAWTILPALLILGAVGVPMLPALFKLGREPDEDALVIDVTGQQWIWSFEYPDYKDARGQPVQTLGEVHLPVGREIALNITSVDVNHSFAIPKLAGTLDAIPGETNRLWIKADEPGTLAGQCREFCGYSHAEMKIVAFAESEEDFEAWIKEMQTGVRSASGSESVVATGE